MHFYGFILLFCLAVFTADLRAQSSLMDHFSLYSTYLSKVADISCKLPHHFTWQGSIDKPQSPSAWEEKWMVACYEGKMMSKDEECLILCPCPTIPLLNCRSDKSSGNPEYSFVRRQLWHDSHSSHTLTTDSILPEYDTENIRTLSGTHTPFHADTVFISRISLNEPYLGKYTHCIGIYAYKHGRMPLSLKCFFTSKGIQKENKYLTNIYKAIKFNHNDHWKYDHELHLQTIAELSALSKPE